jgi:hypothetical protein
MPSGWHEKLREVVWWCNIQRAHCQRARVRTKRHCVCLHETTKMHGYVISKRENVRKYTKCKSFSTQVQYYVVLLMLVRTKTVCSNHFVKRHSWKTQLRLYSPYHGHQAIKNCYEACVHCTLVTWVTEAKLARNPCVLHQDMFAVGLIFLTRCSRLQRSQIVLSSNSHFTFPLP